MPKIQEYPEEYDDPEVSASSAFKSARRQAQSERRHRATVRSDDLVASRRRVRVHAERRREIDAHKVARALLTMAAAELESKAQAEAANTETPRV